MREGVVDAAEVLAVQCSNNLATDANWDSYSEHRARVTALVSAALRSQPAVGARLVVLGAGNCNDVDLAALVEHCSELHLVDYDEGAMVRGLARQQLRSEHSDRARIVLHGGVELSGLAPHLASVGEEDPPRLAEIALAGPVVDIDRPFDVVVSTTLLTQLISLPVRVLGNGFPGLDDIVVAVRNGHLRLITRLLRPGGRGLLVTDVVSSDTLPEVRGTPLGPLARLLEDAVVTGNFFTGTNPYAVSRALSHDPVVSEGVDSASWSGPWRWQMGPSRSYLVVAHSFRRTPVGSS
jgi:hypothetical protein